MSAANKRVRFALRACLAGFVVLAGWWMTRPEPAATWVTLEADHDPVAGQPLHIRARVSSGGEAREMLAVDLHWMNRQREPQGYLSESTPQPVPKSGGVLDFEIPVPDRAQLGSVFAVIYAGHSGSWRDRTRWAYTDPVPVLSSASPLRVESMPWSAHRPRVGATIPRMDSRLAQWLGVSIWLAAAGMCMRRSRGGPAALFVQDPDDSRARRLCALACLAAACWELAAADTVLANIVRGMAIDNHLYYRRETVQVVLTLAALACASWALASILDAVHAHRGRRALLAGLSLFTAASAMALISHHAIDRLASASWWTVPAIQWVKIASGSLALAGAARARAA